MCQNDKIRFWDKEKKAFVPPIWAGRNTGGRCEYFVNSSGEVYAVSYGSEGKHIVCRVKYVEARFEDVQMSLL